MIDSWCTDSYPGVCWLHFCTAGESRCASAIFVYNNTQNTDFTSCYNTNNKHQVTWRRHHTNMIQSLHLPLSLEGKVMLNLTLTEDHDEALIVQEEPQSKAHDDGPTKLENTHTHTQITHENTPDSSQGVWAQLNYSCFSTAASLT